MLSQKHQAEQEELDKKIRELRAALSAGQESMENAKKWVSLIREIGAPTDTDQLSSLGQAREKGVQGRFRGLLVQREKGRFAALLPQAIDFPRGRCYNPLA